jgi:hypothetical protein
MRLLFMVLVVGLLGGCASVSVVDQRNYPLPSLPGHIYVEPFEFRGCEFRVNRRDLALESFQRNFQSDLQSRIVAGFSRAGVRTTSIKLGQFFPGEGDWVVQGEVVRVSEGSRAARASIGFGLGATKVKLYVRVYAIRGGKPDRLLMSFWTVGGSNAEPGGAYYPPWSLPRSLHVAMTSGVSYDLKRSAKQIVAVVLERMEQAGGPQYPYSTPKRPIVYFWESSP